MTRHRRELARYVFFNIATMKERRRKWKAPLRPQRAPPSPSAQHKAAQATAPDGYRKAAIPFRHAGRGAAAIGGRRTDQGSDAGPHQPGKCVASLLLASSSAFSRA